MPGVGRILVRRAIALSIALVIIVMLTAVIMEATGYSTKVWLAIINEQVRALQMQLQQRQVPIDEQREILETYKENLTKIYGLDKPWYVRVMPLVQRTLVFDLGITTKTSPAEVAGVSVPVRVADLIFITLPRTIVMLTVAYLICAAIALSIAPRLAYRHGTLLDRGVITYAALFNAVPVWWLGMVLLFFFAYNLRLVPTSGRGIIPLINNFWQDPWNNFIGILHYAALPVFTVVIVLLGSWLYGIRAMVLRVVREDYVLVAKAKGLPEKLIARRYILRVMAPPVTTYVILALAGSLGGYIITESVFDWPGMGSLYYAAITSADVPTILGLTYVLTLVYVCARFLLEVLYIILDPRVRLG